MHVYACYFQVLGFSPTECTCTWVTCVIAWTCMTYYIYVFCVSIRTMCAFVCVSRSISAFCVLVYLAILVDGSEEDPVLLAVSLSVVPHAAATPINTSINAGSQMEIILSPGRCFSILMSVFIQLPGREEQQDKQFYWWQRKHAAAFFPVFLSWLFHHQTFSVCSNRVEETEGRQEKSKDDGCVDNEEKAEEVLKGENKYICLICMQAFPLLKLSIFPVAIPMRVLDRQEMSGMEYQGALHVHISMQRIATYMHTHARTHTSAQMYTQITNKQKTLMRNHTLTRTYSLIPLPNCLSLTNAHINIHAHTYLPSQIITWMHKHTHSHINRCKFPFNLTKASRYHKHKLFKH